MASPSDREHRLGPLLEIWNRRFHYYLGLYFLLFVWLFSFTGLLLNHPRWTLSRIPNEPSAPFERTIESASGNTDLARATDVVRQLDLRGEIDWPQASQAPGRLEFNIVYPKQATQVHDGCCGRCSYAPTDCWILHVCRKPGCSERGQDVSFRRRQRPPWIDWHGSSPCIRRRVFAVGTRPSA